MDRPNYVKRLPVEIWIQGFLFLRLKDHLMLTRTCHWFYHICIAFVFNKINYISNIEFKKRHAQDEVAIQLGKLENHIEHFASKAGNPKLAPLVRECHLFYACHVYVQADVAIAQAVKDAYTPFISGFFDSVTNLVNLRSIQIEFAKKMDKKLLTTFQTSLPYLEDAPFRCIRFGAHRLRQRFTLRNLVIDNMWGADGDANPSTKSLDLFSAERLEKLNIWSYNYAPKLFRAFTAQGIPKRLTTLNFQLRGEDIPVLYGFLETCPYLLSLKVEYLGYDGTPLPPLPRSAIPRLRNFKGTDIAARTFIPGRPVVSAFLISNGRRTNLQDTQHTVTAIGETIGPLTDLSLRWLEESPETMNLISTHLSSLKKLVSKKVVQEF